MGTLINGVEYGWSDTKVNLLGRTVEGISSIKYSDNREKQNNWGKGSKPVSRGRGKYEAKCSLSLSMKEVEAIQKALPAGKHLSDIPPFDIAVAFDPEDGSNVVVNNTICGVEFTGKSREAKIGDGEIIHEFEMIVAEIKW